MTPTELAKKMLEWQEVQAQADLLKMDIEQAVLKLEKTQTVGCVRASFSAGRKSYDYQAAVEAAGVSNAIVSHYTTYIEKIDWREICLNENIKDIPFTQSAPSVSLKIVA